MGVIFLSGGIILLVCLFVCFGGLSFVSRSVSFALVDYPSFLVCLFVGLVFVFGLWGYLSAWWINLAYLPVCFLFVSKDCCLSFGLFLFFSCPIDYLLVFSFFRVYECLQCGLLSRDSTIFMSE